MGFTAAGDWCLYRVTAGWNKEAPHIRILAHSEPRTCKANSESFFGLADQHFPQGSSLWRAVLSHRLESLLRGNNPGDPDGLKKGREESAWPLETPGSGTLLLSAPLRAKGGFQNQLGAVGGEGSN